MWKQWKQGRPRGTSRGGRVQHAWPRPPTCALPVSAQAACLLLLLARAECFGGLKSLSNGVSSGSYHLEKAESFTTGMFGVGAGNEPSDSPYNMPVKQVHTHAHMHARTFYIHICIHISTSRVFCTCATHAHAHAHAHALYTCTCTGALTPPADGLGARLPKVDRVRVQEHVDGAGLHQERLPGRLSRAATAARAARRLLRGLPSGRVQPLHAVLVQ